jgi:hypothetical protein
MSGLLARPVPRVPATDQRARWGRGRGVSTGGAVVRAAAGVAPNGVPPTTYNRRGRGASISRPLKYKGGKRATRLVNNREESEVYMTKEHDGAWVVCHGVDTLVVNALYLDEFRGPVKRELDERLYEQFDEWKRLAQEVHGDFSTPLQFHGANLQMQPNGAGQGQWPWMLKTPDITLYLSSGSWNGIASVRLNSQYLWSVPSLADALVEVQVLLYEVFQEELFLQVSAVDLCADIAGWSDIDQLDRARHFVTRARKRTGYGTPDWNYDTELQEYSYGRRPTGFDFGRGKKGKSALSCTIYDKTREVQRSGKEWFYDLWHLHGWSEEDGPVWRVEMKFKREALHELEQEGVFHGVEDAYRLPELLPVLWAYAVGQVQGGSDGVPDGWLRCVIPTCDKNRSRWPTHPVWKVVQGAFLVPGEMPEQFGKLVRKRWKEHHVEKGIEAVMGYATSLAAWVGEELAEDGTDLSVFLHWLAMKGQAYLERTGRDFSAEVRRKRVKLGLQTVSS